MTKVAQIMALAAQGLTTRQIACEVYGISLAAPKRVLDGPMAYVRVVVRQRKGGGDSPANAKWRETHRDQYLKIHRAYFERRYRSDLVWRRQWLDANRVRRAQRRKEARDSAAANHP